MGEGEEPKGRTRKNQRGAGGGEWERQKNGEQDFRGRCGKGCPRTGCVCVCVCVCVCAVCVRAVCVCVCIGLCACVRAVCVYIGVHVLLLWCVFFSIARYESQFR